MTEAEWLACDDPAEVLEALRTRASARKLRFFACALARTLQARPTDPRLRAAVDAAEQDADGLLERSQREQAFYDARVAMWELSGRLQVEPLLAGRMSQSIADAPEFQTAFYAIFALDGETENIDQYLAITELGVFPPTTIVAIAREVFGNPFRPVTFSPEWRTGTAVALAGQMYESRDFSAMPVLADALQDAGCNSDDILNHCRGPGPHVRGCGVVDLVLGKE
ncbi:hypothetical protein GobsT_06940 [Gemmata obscuriglobus]|uniref:hypothetical protein n=1 Tax=Gemmata obscuriglobus TaxID=114 RepID=UPI00016C4B8F